VPKSKPIWLIVTDVPVKKPSSNFSEAFTVNFSHCTYLIRCIGKGAFVTKVSFGSCRQGVVKVLDYYVHQTVFRAAVVLQ